MRGLAKMLHEAQQDGIQVIEEAVKDHNYHSNKGFNTYQKRGRIQGLIEMLNMQLNTNITYRIETGNTMVLNDTPM